MGHCSPSLSESQAAHSLRPDPPPFSVRCVELVTRIVSLCVAATRHLPPSSPKGLGRALKGIRKADGDWAGLSRRLRNTAFGLTGFLGDVVARCLSFPLLCLRGGGGMDQP